MRGRQTDGVGAVDSGAVITETGVADDESCETTASQVRATNKPTTARTAPPASEAARHRSRRVLPGSAGTSARVRRR